MASPCPTPPWTAPNSGSPRPMRPCTSSSRRRQTLHRLQQHRLCLIHDLRFPEIGINIEHVAQAFVKTKRRYSFQIPSSLWDRPRVTRSELCSGLLVSEPKFAEPSARPARFGAMRRSEIGV